eukprot:330793-Pyramimonas_sp.AAC.1
MHRTKRRRGSLWGAVPVQKAACSALPQGQGGRARQCVICGSNFSSIDYAKRHVHNSMLKGLCHADRGRTDGALILPQAYDCPACGYVGLDNDDLRRHLLVEHLQAHLHSHIREFELPGLQEALDDYAEQDGRLASSQRTQGESRGRRERQGGRLEEGHARERRQSRQRQIATPVGVTNSHAGVRSRSRSVRPQRRREYRTVEGDLSGVSEK